jgi:hypothetical protein
MGRREETLLGEIERDLLDGKPLADSLRKCVLLGGKSGSVELRDWASKELRGYGPDDGDAPSYRIVPAPIMADAFTGGAMVKGQRIPVSGLPDFVQENISEEMHLRQGVRELDALANSTNGSEGIHFSLPMGAEIASVMDAQSGNSWQHINALYWSIMPAVIHGVLDNVRTALAELVSELIGTMPNDQQVPTPEQAHQAVGVAVYGKKSKVTVTTSQASGKAKSTITPHESSLPQESGFWTQGRKIGAAIVGLAAIVTAIVTVLQFYH